MESIPYQTNGNNIRFDVLIGPNDTVPVNIAYSQKVARKNTYILTSTKRWEMPLQDAKYSLTVSDGVIVDSLSLSPDFVLDGIYYWHRTNFMPQGEFEVWVRD